VVHSCIFCVLPSLACPGALPSFPTRRSSDLRSGGGDFAETTRHEGLSSGLESTEARRAVHLGVPLEDELPRCLGSETLFREPLRSEEHTSELQSRFDLVCRLLLEKKK